MSEDLDGRRSPLNQAMALAPDLDPKRLAEATGLDEDDARLVRNAVLDALGMPSIGDIVKRYVLDVGRGEWASVYLWAGGRVAIFSSWGSYVHVWSHHGFPSVAHFIAQRNISHDYLLSKFAPEKVYDREKTVKRVRESILEMRRERSLDADEARKEWELIGELDDEQIGKDEWYQNTSLGDAAERVRYSFKSDAVFCLQAVWPALVAAVRKDLGLNERGEPAAEAAT